MKRKLTALLLAVLTLCLCTGAMAAGYPIDTQGKDVSLTVYCANAISNYVTDYNETPFFQEIEKATGIHINFIHPATSGMQEAMNLLFLGKELPDIIMCGNYYDGGVFQGLEDGYFVDLTDYLPEYAPDYWQLITSGDEIWRQVSNGDGRVAAFYTIKEPGDTQHRRMLLTQETLDEIGATIPTTLADVEDVFAKMLAHGITPYILDKTGYEPQFLGMYDLMKGFYKDAEGNILYGQVQPAFKDYLTLMHDWYEKGYISKDFIGSNTKNNQTLFDTGKVGMYFDSCAAAYNRGVANGKTVVTAPYPRLTEGQQLHWDDYKKPGYSMVSDYRCTGVITTTCKNIEAAVQWMNYCYTEAGSTLANWGILGENYDVDANGNKVYNDNMLKNPTMSATNTSYYYKQHVWAKLRQPDVVCHAELKTNEGALSIRLRWGDDPLVDNTLVLPTLSYTSDQLNDKNDIMNDLEIYVNEKVLQFITGDEPLDNFDTFVENVWGMGLQDAIDIVAEAYTAYENIHAPQ